MGLEPPPNVMRADKMRREGIGRGIKTGAKTATKDQEREYLARFERLANDPSAALPEWRGTGTDPLGRLRVRIQRVHSKREKPAWLKWLGRGRRLDHAYAQTILAMRAGKIPSFASMRFRGRDAKFVLRGRGLREKLAGLHNYEDPEIRLLAFVDLARKKGVVFVSHDEAFFAIRQHDPLPVDDLRALLVEPGIEIAGAPDRVACAHAADDVYGLEYTLEAPHARLRLCRACVKRLEGPLSNALEVGIMTRTGKLEVERRVVGRLYTIHPPSAHEEYDRLLQTSGDAAQKRAESFEAVTDLDLLDWTQQEFERRLQERKEGHLLIGNDLWLGDFEAAAQRYGSTEGERAALNEAFRRVPPRTRSGDANFSRLVDPAWSEHGIELLRVGGGADLDPATLRDLAQQRPAEAFASMGRLLENERRFTGFPRFGALPTPLRLAHDLFKAQRAGDTFQFQRRLSEGIRDPSTKPLALALARAFGQGGGVEWQFAPHEKDQALFFEPAALELAASGPEGYVAALAHLAEALSLPPPVAVTTTAVPPA